MKKIVILLLMSIALTGCRADSNKLPVHNSEQKQNGSLHINDGQDTTELSSTGKIVIITNRFDYNNEAFLVADAFVKRFGEEKIEHIIWPGFESEGRIPGILQDVSEDPDVGALIINNSYFGNRLVLESLHNIREDIFVVYVPIFAYFGFYENKSTDIKADLIIETNMQKLGEQYVKQAKSMGVEVIAHYSFPRYMAAPSLITRRDAMRETAVQEGILFTEIAILDPFLDFRGDLIPLFITQDLPRQVEELGINTAFFGLCCSMQIPIISQTIATGAIFVNTCCVSPFHRLPEAVDINVEPPTSETDEFGVPIVRRLELSELIEEIDEAVSAVGMAGRISSWAVSDSMMWTTIGVMYALEWLGGNVPQEFGVIDLDVIKRLAKEYTIDLGVDTVITLEYFSHNGEIVGHYIQGVIDYHVFG